MDNLDKAVNSDAEEESKSAEAEIHVESPIVSPTKRSRGRPKKPKEIVISSKSKRINKLLSDQDKFEQINKNLSGALATDEKLKWSNRKAALKSRFKKRDENKYLSDYIKKQNRK